jgi:hypothetical protein
MKLYHKYLYKIKIIIIKELKMEENFDENSDKK